MALEELFYLIVQPLALCGHQYKLLAHSLLPLTPYIALEVSQLPKAKGQQRLSALEELYHYCPILEG